MTGVNEIEVKMYCVQRGRNAEILVDEEIYDEFDEWMSYNSDAFFKDWCEENHYDMNAEDWDDVRDDAYDEFYDEMCDDMWETFADENILALRTIRRKLW